MTGKLFMDEIFTQMDSKKITTKEENLRVDLLNDPGNIKKMEELAILMYHKGDYDGAIALYQRILQLENVSNQYSFLGYLYFEKEEYEKAISFFEKSLDLNPNNAFVYFLLGNAYSRVGKVIQAVNNYDIAIFLDLDIYKAHVDFAKKYEAMGLLDRAIKEYTIAYEIDPRNKKIKTKIENLKDRLKQ